MSSWADIVTVTCSDLATMAGLCFCVDIVTMTCSDLVTMAGLCEFLGRHCYSDLF